MAVDIRHPTGCVNGLKRCSRDIVGLPIWTVLHESGEVGEVSAEAEDPFVLVQPERCVAELGQVPGVKQTQTNGFRVGSVRGG